MGKADGRRDGQNAQTPVLGAGGNGANNANEHAAVEVMGDGEGRAAGAETGVHAAGGTLDAAVPVCFWGNSVAEHGVNSRELSLRVGTVRVLGQRASERPQQPRAEGLRIGPRRMGRGTRVAISIVVIIVAARGAERALDGNHCCGASNAAVDTHRIVEFNN